MLIGYVSDEQYVALADVAVEFIDAEGNSYETHSRASGAVYAELPSGEYRVVLSKPGYGSKLVQLTPDAQQPHHFRLLSDGLLGYAWPKCVRSGETSEFRVHAVEPFHLELWRYGLKKELVRGLGWHDEHGPRAMMQITPDGDYSQTGVQWNRIGYRDSSLQTQRVEAPARSGLYYFHASTASGKQFTFPWVVAPKEPQAAVAVLASDLNWNSYNSFGGRSNYIHADELPRTPTVNSRQELKRYSESNFQTWNCSGYVPLSFDRPEPLNHIDPRTEVTDSIAGRAACHTAAAEWRLLGWLEREKFAYDLYSETQLHHGVLDLSCYRVLILGPHPEYWSRAMYDRVKDWVFNEGGKLMYLGGNGLNCEVTLEAHRMHVNNGQIASLWPEEIGAESRFAKQYESEAGLLGVVFTPAGIMTGAPYRVVDESHWIFEGTGKHNGDLFGLNSQHERCPGGASGHETDKISASSPPGTRLLAKGTNPDNGGAEMVTYRTASGGEVFSVGSISYVSSLLVDDTISRITANALSRFQAGAK